VTTQLQLINIIVILIERRGNSNILNVRSIRGTYCGTDHYMVVAKVWKILAVNKEAAQKFDVEIFNLRKPNEHKLGNNIKLRSESGLLLWRT